MASAHILSMQNGLTHVLGLQVNGFAAQYEKTGDKDALTAVQHFFDVITHHHSYATGG